MCNVHAPNKKGPGSEFFKSLYTILDLDTLLVLCGDFNTVVDASRDRIGCNPNSVWAYNWSPSLNLLMTVYDLHDVWRLRHPNAIEFTWRRPNGKQASWLDMFWVSSLFLALVSRVDIPPFFRSDHSYVYLELGSATPVHRERGLWKLNVSHLKNPELAELVSDFWKSWRQMKSSFLSLSAW